MKYRKRCLLRSNKPIIETLTNKVVYCPTKNKNSRKRVHLQMCSIAAFFVELLNSCLIQGIQQFAILNMGVNFPNGSVGKCKYDLFDLHIIQGVEPLTNRQFLILRILKVTHYKQGKKINNTHFLILLLSISLYGSIILSFLLQ